MRHKTIELSQLALEKSSNPEVKAFADEIIRGHRQANDRLRDVVSRSAISVGRLLRRSPG
jgi:predicted outer membrane protein